MGWELSEGTQNHKNKKKEGKDTTGLPSLGFGVENPEGLVAAGHVNRLGCLGLIPVVPGSGGFRVKGLGFRV